MATIIKNKEKGLKIPVNGKVAEKKMTKAQIINELSKSVNKAMNKRFMEDLFK